MDRKISLPDYEWLAEKLEEKDYLDFSLEEKVKYKAAIMKAKVKDNIFNRFVYIVSDAFEENMEFLEELGKYSVSYYGPEGADAPVAVLDDFLDDYKVQYWNEGEEGLDYPVVEIEGEKGYMRFYPEEGMEGNTLFDSELEDKKALADIIKTLSEVVDNEQEYLERYESLMQHAVAREENKRRG
ncbi:MAG: hypothetical protein MUP58_02875 [Candidatus Nanohaloarchaeota archaeon QJJ-9]|nr:hypothetical protein [Candidatus Nanohaloarchaeota archaeon QJJ-9]